MIPLPTDPLELAILLYKSMQGRGVHIGIVSGALDTTLDFDAVVTRLESAQQLCTQNASTRHLEWYLPVGFFMSLDQLLSAPARRIKAPPRFYLADLDQLCTSDAATQSIAVRGYVAATKLHGLLAQVADHQGGVASDKTLIFLHRGTVEITPEYGVSDLCLLDGLDAFASDFILSETHQEQKRTILKTVLLELFAGKSRLPFSQVLARFSDLKEKMRAGYQLYVAEFSFQKVKTEVEKEKLDAMLKLNKVFSDIQNQLLGVPAALILAGGQMKMDGPLDAKNVVIWLGTLVFTALMALLIRNQRHTLRAVQEEIAQQKEQLRTKFQAISERFKDIYDEIEKRHTHQTRLILVVDILVALTFCCITLLLIWLSPALQAMLAATWGALKTLSLPCF